MSSQKTYVPRSSVRARQTQFGEFINIGLSVDDFAKFMEQHKNDRGYINLTLGKRRTASDRGDTHSLWLDDYKPGPRQQPAPEQKGFADVASGFPAQDNTDVPFN